MALTEQTEPRKGPSLVLQVGLLAGLTALAIGMGWLAGGNLVDKMPTGKPVHTADNGEGSGEHAEDSVTNVVPLEPITTNLAAPSSMWARLELSLVFDGPADPALAQTIHQDLFAYLRTIKLNQVESASGFQHLKSDLEERARIRSEGRVSQILIKTLLFE